MDLITQKWSEMVEVTAFGRLETLDPILSEKKGQSAFFCFKAFQTN